MARTSDYASKADRPPGSLLDCSLLFVTGKGGVGKSTVAAALALRASQAGKRVLACEFDAKGDLLASFAGAGARGGRQDRPLGFVPRELLPGMYAMAMDPEESLREYLKLQLRIPLIPKIGALSAAFDFLANAAPGIREIVTVGKVAYEVREKHYDLVVVDATATGHIIGQLRAPQAINELVGVGLIRSQTNWMLEILGDRSRTGVVITTTASELPVTESIELVDKLRTQTNVNVAGIVVNRLLPEPFVSSTSQALAKLSGSRQREFQAVVGDAPSALTLIEAGKLAHDLRRREAEQLEVLRAFTATLGLPEPALIPMLFDAEPGSDTTRQVSAHLADEWGLP